MSEQTAQLSPAHEKARMIVRNRSRLECLHNRMELEEEYMTDRMEKLWMALTTEEKDAVDKYYREVYDRRTAMDRYIEARVMLKGRSQVQMRLSDESVSFWEKYRDEAYASMTESERAEIGV